MNCLMRRNFLHSFQDFQQVNADTRLITLVALAALAAFGAQAQSSVQIDGLMDAGYQSIDYKGNKVSGISGNGSTTSQINFRGTEDLGGGMKANWRIENDWNIVSNGINQGAATNSASPVGTTALGTFGNGELRVGLSGNFGAVDFGAINNNTLGWAHGIANPFGTAIGAGYATITRANPAGNAVRSDNSFRYTTPTINGVTAAYIYAAKQTVGTQTLSPSYNGFGYYLFSGTKEASIKYENGPFVGTYVSQKVDQNGTNALTTPQAGVVTTLNSLAASYVYGDFKFLFLNQTNKNSGATGSVDMNATLYGAQYTMGATTFTVMTGGNKNNVAYGSANTNGATSVATSKITGIGADYALSKTTNLYLRNESLRDDANLAGGYYNATTSVFNTPSSSTGATRTRTALGLRVAF